MTEIDTVVIGASASGLATAACLKQAGIPHVLLERERHVGHAWRNHYERLHLHTPRSISSLPGFPMPRDYPQYASREQVVAYFEAYVAHHGLEPRYGAEVARVLRDGDKWRVETSTEQLRCRTVVIATGFTHTPKVPSWADQEKFKGEVLHSSKYRNGAAWAGKRVLVVGLGNSGGEIAIDLVEHGAKVTLAVRSPINIIPRDILGMSIMSVGKLLGFLPPWLADLLGAPLVRLVVGNVEKLGLRKLPYGPSTQLVKDGRIPLIDIGTVGLIRAGKLQVRGAPVRFTETGVVFDDGTEKPFDAVVLATGYTPSLERFLEPASQVANEKGLPRESGREVLPGLYLCGFRVSPRGMLREIGIEAEQIARAIRAGRSTPLA